MKRHDQEQMRILYNQWKGSGESQIVFARRNGIRPTTFYYWRCKFEKVGPKSEKGPAVGFRPIALNAATIEGPQPTAVIHYPSGTRLELHTALDAHFLKSLVE